MWRTRIFIFILMILIDPQEEPPNPPTNTSYLHKRRRLGVSVCDCGFIARSTEERNTHKCNVSNFNTHLQRLCVTIYVFRVYYFGLFFNILEFDIKSSYSDMLCTYFTFVNLRTKFYYY